MASLVSDKAKRKPVKVFCPYQFIPENATEHCGGISLTIPNEATSLKELVRRSQIMANLPEISRNLDYGDDETFDDAFERDFDLSDISDNRSYIERTVAKLEEHQASALKAKEAKIQAELDRQKAEESSNIDPRPKEA